MLREQEAEAPNPVRRHTVPRKHAWADTSRQVGICQQQNSRAPSTPKLAQRDSGCFCMFLRIFHSAPPPPVLLPSTALVKAHGEKTPILLSKEIVFLDFGLVKSVPTHKERKVI